MTKLQNETSNKKFTLDRITDRIFLIVSREQLYNGMYHDLPIAVYGLLKVTGESFDNSFTSYMHISDVLCGSEELYILSIQAREYVFYQSCQP